MTFLLGKSFQLVTGALNSLNSPSNEDNERGAQGTPNSSPTSPTINRRKLRSPLSGSRKESLNDDKGVPPDQIVISQSSAMTTIDQATNPIITSTMTCPDIVAILTSDGCADLTLSLDRSACIEYPVASGGLGDVFYGRLFDGTPVAIKTIRGYYNMGQSVRVYNKRAAKEIYTWSKCKHPNIVQLKGLAVFRECLAMISRWEENGNLLQYLSCHPFADRCQLSTSICAGLVYLHDSGIVHGDLKGANILIAQDGTPMLMDFGNADFGNASRLDPTVQFTQTNTGVKFSLRWTAPEILGETSSHTTAGDVYSLGMTILEAFTSNIPFADKSDLSVLALITARTLIPTRPEDIIPKRSIYGDNLWAILMKCWSYDPQDRPTAGAVWNVMRQLSPEKLKEIED